MRISDWSSDVRSSDLADENRYRIAQHEIERGLARRSGVRNLVDQQAIALLAVGGRRATDAYHAHQLLGAGRDREHRWAHHQIATGAEQGLAVRLAPRDNANLGAQRFAAGVAEPGDRQSLVSGK